MKLNLKILFWLLFCLALLPVIFYPVSTDLGEFLLGGKTIFLGRKIYVDFIDIKPPLCYYIFAGFYFFSRNSETAIRIIDVVWQLLTAASIIFAVKKATDRELSGYFAALVYSITYTVLQYYNTFQLETMLALPLVWIIHLLVSGRKKGSLAIAGLLIGLITGLKYTFGIIIFPILIFVFFDERKTVKARIYAGLTISIFSVAALAVASLPLLMPDVRGEFLNIAFYVNQYNARSFPNLYLTALKTTYIQLTGKFSFLFLMSALLPVIVVIINFFKKRKKRTSVTNEKVPYQRFMVINLMLLIFLWFSIVIEQKFFEYHFARLFLPLSLLAGSGLEKVSEFAKNVWNSKKAGYKILIIIVLAVGLFGSPLPTWFRLLRVPYYYATDRAKYNIYYEIPDNPVRYRVFYVQAADYLRQNAGKNDKMFVMGIGSNIIYLLAEADNFSRYSMSSFYFYKDAPESWKNDIYREMSSSEWLIVAYRSSYPYFTRDNKTVLENINEKPRLDSLLRNGFDMKFQNEQYQIYKRKTTK